jgi:hypothetical protein
VPCKEWWSARVCEYGKNHNVCAECQLLNMVKEELDFAYLTLLDFGHLFARDGTCKEVEGPQTFGSEAAAMPH